MENVIETLYTNLPRPQAPDDPELEKAREEYIKMCDLIAEHYGPDFLDQFTALRDRTNAQNWEREFTLGFRACARLMLEALRPG